MQDLVLGDADRVLLFGIRAAAAPDGLCPCVYTIYTSWFGEHGPIILTKVKAISDLLEVKGRRKLNFGQPDEQTLTLDEASLLMALHASQSRLDSDQHAHLKWLFGMNPSPLLTNLIDDVGYMFRHIGLSFSRPAIQCVAN